MFSWAVIVSVWWLLIGYFTDPRIERLARFICSLPLSIFLFPPTPNVLHKKTNVASLDVHALVLIENTTRRVSRRVWQNKIGKSLPWHCLARLNSRAKRAHVNFIIHLGCVPLKWSRKGSVIQDLSGSWCIKGTDKSTLAIDSPVPLMHHDPDRSWITVILIKITPKERTLDTR